MSFLAVLFAMIPKPASKFAYRFFYADFYHGLQKKVVEWHKSELEELDVGYSSLQDDLRLVKARQKAIADGVGPMDPEYPSLEDVSPRFKKMLSE